MEVLFEIRTEVLKCGMIIPARVMYDSVKNKIGEKVPGYGTILEVYESDGRYYVKMLTDKTEKVSTTIQSFSIASKGGAM